MFEKIKRLMARSGSASTDNNRRQNDNARVVWERKNAADSAPKPHLATSRAHAPEDATRARSNATFGPPSADSAMVAKRNQTVAQGGAPANISNDNRRIEKLPRNAERVKGGQFMDTTTAGGTRNLRQAKAKEVQFKTKDGLTDGITLRHRSGSVTGLQLSPSESKVTSAFHTSVTTGETTQVHARQMKGKTARELNRVARRKDHRNPQSE